MRVFISWSGDRSKAMAKALSKFIRRVMQNAKPWMSEDDIGKGSIWFSEIQEVLQACNFGLLCITNENVSADWVLFEAGALSKGLSAARVVPVCLDFPASKLRPPLGMFNASSTDQADMLRLFSEINRGLDAGRLESAELHEQFQKWWDDFEAERKAIPSSTAEAPAPPTTDQRLERMEALLERLTTTGDTSASLPRTRAFRVAIGADDGVTTKVSIGLKRPVGAAVRKLFLRDLLFVFPRASVVWQSPTRLTIDYSGGLPVGKIEQMLESAELPVEEVVSETTPF